HTIAWSVTDSAGRTEGIGSRFFTVLNGSSRASADATAAALRDLAEAPAVERAPASTVAALALSDGSIWARTGFDLAAAYVPLPADAAGSRFATLPELGRLELWLGPGVDRGYLVANGTLRDLPPG